MTRVFRSLEEARGRFGPCVLSIGNFDGVHLGHQRLLREVSATASAFGLPAAVLTFHPHPAQIIAPERAPRLLTTAEERCRKMAEYGIEQVLILPFTRELSLFEPAQFTEQVLVEALQARHVLVGGNFRFGRGQQGSTETLRELGLHYGFGMNTVAAESLRGTVISSSAIRRHILEGRVARAARMLGRFYAVEGAILKGKGIGSTRTVPTLNVEASQEVVPATGVYVSRTQVTGENRSWPSITNIGYRPTFGDGAEGRTIETHLLEPLEGATPARIRVEFTHRVRDERRFESVELLKEQILRDAARAKAWHAHWQSWRGSRLENVV
ncbi:MAG: bifunctional riboflavin kinase/FAD synthetase [Candidatus Solibacter usitatus]|nr:bifunctional riboflavin kinase/FAD synthetase [Candidatus Solibacter usitatus]